MVKKPGKFTPAARARAVQTVRERRGEYASLTAAIDALAPKLGCVPQTLRQWVRDAETGAAVPPGTRAAEARRIRALEREVAELRRANAALQQAHAPRTPAEPQGPFA